MSSSFARSEAAAVARTGASLVQRAARRALRTALTRLRHGGLTVIEGGRAERFGDPDHPLQGALKVRDPRFWTDVLARGGVGAGESWVEGRWSSDDLTAVIRVAVANRDFLAAIERGPARLARPALRAAHALRRNTRRGARRNIAAHYDLGNEFFGLFLDPTLSYSCAFFERPGASLEEAQRAKLERLCRALELQPQDHVLDIGGGWGGFALHAASCHGCRVTTATVSRAQYELARERVATAGLADRVEVLLRDYRDLDGAYDKLVSIEMIEAVGADYLETFFRACAERLRPDGLFALQAITVPDGDWETSLRSVDFVKRYVFPGGQLVSVGALAHAASATDLRWLRLEDMTPHYAETLARWRRNLEAGRDRARALGLDERFLRLWRYYLCYCEAGFRERANGVAQMLFAKPGARRGALWERSG